MKTRITFITLLLLATTTVATNLLAADDVASKITAVAEKASNEGRFSGVVLVARDGKPVVSRAYGFADAAHTVRNTVDTKFNLGSVNKLFTTIAIGQLAAAGKLSIDDPVAKYLPDLPIPSANVITIEQLLTHRSGLGDIFGPKFDAAPPSSLRKLSDYVPLFANAPLEFEPGARQRYSNAGFIVLGLIVEKLSGQNYYDYVRDHITKPAGMRDTASYAVDEKVANRATGLTNRGPDGPLAERIANTATLPGRGSSAGGGYSTAADMLKLSQALLADRLLPKKWTDWVFTRRLDGTGERNLGVAGGAPGINADVSITPPWTVIVLSNFDPPSAEEMAENVRTAAGIAGPRRRRQAAGPGEVLIRRPVDLAMAIEDHIPVIEAKVNGKGPYRFAVDTGFGGAIQVTPELAQSLALPVTGEAIAGDPSGKNTRTMRMMRIDSIDIADVHLGGIEAGEQNRRRLTDTDGVIGLRLFDSLLVTFDYPKSRFRVETGELRDGAIPYNTDRSVPGIDIDVAGTKANVDIDSGSPGLVTLPLSMAKSLTLTEEPKVVGHARTPSNEFDIYGSTLRGDVHVGSITVNNPRVDFIEIFPVGNIGYRFLKDLVVTFDPAAKKVRFVAP